MRRFLISYDISNNKSRLSASKILLNFGERLQRSVYIVDATDNQIKSLNNKLLDLLDDDDSLLILPCCKSCWEKALFAHTDTSLIIVA